MKLNTDDKNNFVFEYDDIQIQVPGGLNDEKLDSLRVTLKINKADSHVNVRHSLNLFNHTQVEKFLLQVSYQLEISDTMVRKAFIKLTDELEQHRLTQPSQSDEQVAIEYQLPKEEFIEAKDFLCAENLLERTNNRIGASGIIGEENNRLLMYLIFTSRKTTNPLHCISFGSSGVGKTHLQSNVSELIPSEDKVEITQLSANAFYYFNRYDLKNKLVLIEDMDGAEDGLLPLRELQTKKRISKSVVQKSIGGRGRTNNLVVEGPVCVAGCTTQEGMYQDNANRSFLLYIDESSEQDERIMAYQRMLYAGKVDGDYQDVSAKLLRNVQRLLKPIKVINPYAEHLKLPNTVFKPRRTNLHYLQLIEVVTFYHQHQREERCDETTGEVYIETTLEDIKMANTLIKEVLLRKSDRLNGAARTYFESLSGYLAENNSQTYSNTEIRREFGISETTLRRHHKVLLAEGYIEKVGGNRTESFEYKLLDVNEFKDLEATIEKALNLCLEYATPPSVRHSGNGEPK
ncbi:MULTISPECIES: hypothetical protein [Flavobacteriaceae]|uniref:Uncharacterized protein n=2 Tax=Flavobacteriaceae TaxID=49546 RepID=A0A4Y8ARR4_9FLAO|nr:MULTISPECIES: hypothetical protein [Flavobacteriaceae]TEW73881.1 hypothetical protein E2488_10405 [Gramella jeungdoensis]GGK38362.1 hypothetical protein GCM10007963_03140 [Lutibacter litoralis]